MLDKHPRLTSDDAPSFTADQLHSLVIQLDSRVTELLNGVDLLRNIQVNDSTLLYDYFTSTNGKMQLLFDSAGTKPTVIDQSSNAPDLWLAVTSIISKLKIIPQICQKLLLP